MAKRFTDSTKWQKPWFNNLETKHKLFWLYILDSCNHAGIWDCNISLAEFQLNEKFAALFVCPKTNTDDLESGGLEEIAAALGPVERDPGFERRAFQETPCLVRPESNAGLEAAGAADGDDEITVVGCVCGEPGAGQPADRRPGIGGLVPGRSGDPPDTSNRGGQ